MTNVDIRKAIDTNNAMIESAMRPNQFVLNGVVRDLLNENKKLQDQCNHEFNEDDYCIYCDFIKGE